MSSDSNKSGLLSAVSASCRAALREVMCDATGREALAPEAREHVDSCGFCSARVQARESLSSWVSARPTVPAELMSASVLERIYERVTEAAELGPVGSWLEQAPVSTNEALQDSSLEAGRLTETAAQTELLGDFVRSPAQPDPQVWTGVCRSILEGVASERVVRRQTGWRVLLVGAAAAAVVGLLSIQEEAPVQPTITFADLDRAPDVAFANVRYGARY